MLLTNRLYCFSMYWTLISINTVFPELLLLGEACSGYVEWNIGTHLSSSCFLTLPTTMYTVHTRGRVWLFLVSYPGFYVAMNISSVPYGLGQAASSLSGLSPFAMSYYSLLSCYSKPHAPLSLNPEAAEYNTHLNQDTSSEPHLEWAMGIPSS